jgi:hypothetical protein
MVEALARAAERHLSVSDRRFHARRPVVAKPMMTLDVGEGPPVLLLRGFGLSPCLYRRSAE